MGVFSFYFYMFDSVLLNREIFFYCFILILYCDWILFLVVVFVIIFLFDYMFFVVVNDLKKMFFGFLEICLNIDFVLYFIK